MLWRWAGLRHPGPGCGHQVPAPDRPAHPSLLALGTAAPPSWSQPGQGAWDRALQFCVAQLHTWRSQQEGQPGAQGQWGWRQGHPWAEQEPAQTGGGIFIGQSHHQTAEQNFLLSADSWLYRGTGGQVWLAVVPSGPPRAPNAMLGWAVLAPRALQSLWGEGRVDGGWKRQSSGGHPGQGALELSPELEAPWVQACSVGPGPPVWAWVAAVAGRGPGSGDASRGAARPCAESLSWSHLQ